MKKYLPLALKISIYVIYFVTVGRLFEQGKFMAGALLIGGFLLGLFLVERLQTQEKLIQELDWINRCLMNKSEYENAQQQRAFYLFVLGHLRNHNIKPGMTLKEIENFINEHRGGDDFSFRPALYFGSEGRLQRNKLFLNGFGVAIPTPQLVMRFRRGTLVRWKECC